MKVVISRGNGFGELPDAGECVLMVMPMRHRVREGRHPGAPGERACVRDTGLGFVGNGASPSHGGGGARGTRETCQWRTWQRGRWEPRRLTSPEAERRVSRTRAWLTGVKSSERWGKISNGKRPWDVGLDENSLVQGVGRKSG